MRAWRRVMIGVLAAALFFASIVVFRGPPDPVFEGRYSSQWADDLLSTDYKTRMDAQAALLVLGERAVPQLRLLLQRRSRPWDAHIARLNRWFPFIHYKSRDAGLSRQRGAEMIGLLGAKGSEAIPSLVESLAMEACAVDAERALMRCGEAALPALERALCDKSADIRWRSAKLLREYKDLSSSTVDALIRLVADKQACVRRQVAHTLGEVSVRPDAAAVRRALQALAVDPAIEVRAASIEALGKRDATADSIAVVRHALNDPAVLVRLHAAKALWRLNGDTATVLPVLTRILPTHESWQAAYALAQMGDAAAPAVPGLIEALRRERVPRPYRTPPSCAFALGQIGAAAIPALHPLLEAADARTRMNAIMAIGFMGPRGKNAVPELLRLLEDKDSEVRHVAALTLASVGAERDQVLPGLSACLAAEDIYMRSAAAQALREIAPEQNWVVNPE
jgi:HEAT repeat protein